MPQICALCRHEDREQIEAEIVGGMSLREAARTWNLHFTQVWRHMNQHYTKAYVPRQPAYRRLSESNLSREVDDIGRSLDQVDGKEPSALDKVRDLHARVERVMVYAERCGNSGEILRAASELRRIVELEAKLTGEVDQHMDQKKENEYPIIRVRLRFDLPDDDPRCYQFRRFNPETKEFELLPLGDDVVDAEYEEVQ